MAKKSPSYIDQIYGGNAPSMNYYYQLGQQKAYNQEMARRAREEERRRQREAESQAKEAEKQAKKATKEAEKKASDEALSKLLSELQPTSSTATAKTATAKTPKKNTSFWSDILNIGKNIITSGAAFDPKKAPRAAINMAKDYATNDRQLDPITKEATRGVARASNLATLNAVKHLSRKGPNAEAMDEAFFNQRSGKGAVADVGYDILGSLLPGSAIARGLRGTIAGARVAPEMSRLAKAGQYAKEGAVAGGLFGAAESGVTEALAPDERDWKDHLTSIGLEAGLGAVADPAIMGLMGGLRRARPNVDVPQELLALPAPGKPYSMRNVLSEPLSLPEPPKQLPAPDQRFTQAQERIKQAEQEITQLEEQINNFDSLMNEKFVNFRDNDLRTHREQEITSQQAVENYRRMHEEAEKSFIENARFDYEKQVADAHMEWDKVKELRRFYKQIRESKESKFYVPAQFREELGNIIPRSFIRNDATMDVFTAAEAHGFRGDHEGVFEFANYLRQAQQANTIRKKDLIPKEPEELNVDRLREQFRQTDDSLGMDKLIKDLEAEVQRMKTNPPSFEHTQEYKETMKIRKAYEEQLSKLKEESQSLEAQIQEYNAGQSPLALPRKQPVEPEFPQAQRIEESTSQQSEIARTGVDVADRTVYTDLQKQSQQPTNKTVYDANNRKVKESETNLAVKNRATVKFTDDLHGIEYTYDRLGKGKIAYEDARIVKGGESAAELYINQNLTPAFKNFKGSDKDLQNATKFLVERHLLDIVNKSPNYRIPNGANKAQLLETKKKFENLPEVKKLAKEVRKYQRGILDMLEKEGILSKEAKETLIKEYPNYIPLYRQKGSSDLDSVFETYSRMNKGNVRKVIQELSEFGSEDLIKDPISNLVQYGVNAHRAIFSNRAMKHLKDIDGMSINGKLVAKKLTLAEQKRANKDNLVQFFEDGKTVTYYVNNDLKQAYDNMKGAMSIADVNAFFNTAKKVTRFMRQSITANPLFSLRQLPRDIVQGWANSGYRASDLAVSLIDVMTQGKLLGDKSLYREFIKHGGGMNNVVSFDRNQFLSLQRYSKKLIEDRNIVQVAAHETEHAFKTLLDQIRLFNEGAENVQKVARYRAVKRETGDARKATYEGRDMMDYGRAGETIRQVNDYAAFINANIQGKSKQVRSLADTPLQTSLRVATAGVIPSVLAKIAVDELASDKQRATINEAPEWLRQTYWLIPNPLDENKVWRIPKPYEVSVLASTPTEFILNNEDKIGTSLADGMKEWVTQAVFLDPSLNVATPAYETLTGVDTFRGTTIVPQREQDLPGSEQRDVYTSSTAQGIADLLNLTGLDISPRKVEHLTEGYAPISGENVNDLIDRLLELGGIRENQKPKGMADLTPAALNPFSMDISQRTSPLVSNAHESTRELQTMKRRMQNEGLEFPYHNAYGANRMISDRDSDIAETLRMIDNDPTLSREQKQELRQQYVDDRNLNVRNAEGLGLFNVGDEDNLARLESRYAGLGREQNKDDIRTQLQARLVQAGVPEYAVKEVMKLAKERKMSDEQLANALQQLLDNYQ